MDRVLEAVERDLAEDGRDRVVDAADDQIEPGAGIVLPRHQLLEGQRLAEHRRRLGERQRRAGVQEPEILGERAVQTVAELVRERQHAPPLAGVVHQHVRVDVRDERRAEGAEHLPRPHRGVDPLVLEEVADDLARHRREVRERLEHEFLRVVPRDRAADLLERREAVVVPQPRQAEQPRLEGVEAPRDVVAGDDRVDEALRRLVRDLVREVLGRDPRVVAAQAILDRALVQDRVQDVAARPEARPERLA